MEITKEEVEKIMSAEGEVRGTTFKTDEAFIQREVGEDGPKKVEEELQKMGHPLKYADMNGMDFYPIGMRILSLIAIKKALNFSDEKIKEMGSNAPRASLLIKFFMKHFLSPEKTFARSGEMWDKHYTAGKLEAVNVDIAGKTVVMRLTGVKIHPIFCTYLAGYFGGVGKLVVQKEAETKEHKCPFNGDDVHEFTIKW